MIKKLIIENFLSFDSRQTIDFTSVDNLSQNTFSIIGSNSSGKSNVLKTLDFIKTFATESFSYDSESPIKINKNKFSELKNTFLQLIFELKNKEYIYTIKINDIVLFEELKCNDMILFSIQNKIEQLNNKNEDTYINYEILRTTNAEDTIMDDAEVAEVQKLVRPNASFISTFPQINKKHFLYIYNYFKNISIYDSTHSTLDQLFHNNSFIKLITDDNYKKEILNILQLVDNDIDNFEPITKKIDEKQIKIKFNIDTNKMETITSDTKSEIEELKFNKNGKEFRYDEQSHGVLKLLQVLHKLLPIIHNGGVLIVDEIENGLHPRIYKNILDLFNNSDNAQLIFTTHNLIFLDTMKKDQICIIEKNNNISFVKQLKDLEPKEKIYFNFLREYMTGVYDSIFETDIPDFNWLDKS